MRHPGIWSFIAPLVGVGFKLSGWENIYAAYFCWIISLILALYAIKGWWIPWFKKSTEPKLILPDKIQLIQELYNELDSIEIDEKYNIQSLNDTRNRINEWKVKAKRLIGKVLRQRELNNFILIIKAIEDKDEYSNNNIGWIQALENEKGAYLIYLKDLLDSLKKHPELWD